MRRRTVLLTKQTFCSFLGILILAACSPSGIQQDIQTYQARLANVLDADTPESEAIESVHYPTASTLRHNLEEQSISLRVFYNLEKCPAKPLIAERNTSLGRAQLPSQRLLHEHKLIEALRLCIKHNPDTSAQLQTWLETKQSNLPKTWSNMLQLSEEIKVTLTLARSPLVIEDKARLTEYKMAWQTLLDAQIQPNEQALESALRYLKLNPLAAKVWDAQAQVSGGLDQLTPWLIEEVQRLDCRQPQTGYLANVFNRYFVEDVQPLANIINQFHYTMQDTFEQLLQHPMLNQALKDLFMSQHIQDFERYKNAMGTHVKFWQQHFKSCGIKPGRSSI